MRWLLWRKVIYNGMKVPSSGKHLNRFFIQIYHMVRLVSKYIENVERFLRCISYVTWILSFKKQIFKIWLCSMICVFFMLPSKKVILFFISRHKNPD